jgi:anti-repressor protein
MEDLVKVSVSKGGKQVVSARELYDFLEVKNHFTQWFDDNKEMFDDGIDYQSFKVKVNAGHTSSLKTDYAITLSMAKELAMMSKVEKGKHVRKYFIECEKRLQAVNSIPQSFADALMLAANQQKQIEERQQQIDVLAPKASYFDSVKDAQNAITMEEVVKLLNNNSFGRTRLFQFLRDKNIFTQKNLPFQIYMDRGYFRVIQNSHVDRDGAIHTYPQVLAYPKGVAYINKIITM